MEDHEDLLAGGRTWLEHAKELLDKDGVSKTESISWAAYEASQCPALKFPNTTSFMLPLFTEPANSPISVYHGMRMAQEALRHLNPGQIPVLVADQPLYSLAKK